MKLGLSEPKEPLFFIKAASSYADPDATIYKPADYTGTVVFEGELAIVIGTTCHNASLDEAKTAIFGYTCVNDITATDILHKDPSFAQWTRAKSFDGFSPFGPVIATGLQPGNCSPLPVRHHADRMIGLLARAARNASRAVMPCSRPVAMTLAAAA